MMQRVLSFIAAAGLTAGTLYATLGPRDYRSHWRSHQHHQHHYDQGGNHDDHHRNCEAPADEA